MVTQQQIDAHDALIQSLTTRFGKGLSDRFADLLTSIALLGPNPTRLQVQNLFAPLQGYVTDQRGLLNEIYASNVSMNAQVIDANLFSTQVETAIQETLVSVQKSIDTQQNNIINSVVLGSIAGTGIALLVKELKPVVKKAINTIVNGVNTIIRNFDGAVTILRSAVAGIDRFRYVGGLIPTSRNFCQSHNGDIMTLKEINNIWKSQTWGGKAPGNPFVVRGGYNCRHHFVPVGANETV
jgi:hypothetical protein